MFALTAVLVLMYAQQRQSNQHKRLYSFYKKQRLPEGGLFYVPETAFWKIGIKNQSREVMHPTQLPAIELNE